MRATILILIVVGLSACVTGRPPAARHAADPLISEFNVIKAAEFSGTHYANVLEALKARRPRFLTARGPDGTRLPVVYLDGFRLGTPTDLQSVSAEIVTEVRFLSSIAASARFGPDHTAGAILVESRRRMR